MDRDSNPVAGAAAAPDSPDTGTEAAESKKGGRKKDKKEKKKAKAKKPTKQKKGKGEAEPAVNSNVTDVAERTQVGAGPSALEPSRHQPAEDVQRRDSGIEEGAGRLADETPQSEGSHTARDSHDHADPDEEESGVVEGHREKSRSRSGSRKRFSFFRRRGRSGRRDRSKSETDLSKVEGKDKSKHEDSSEDMKPRDASSLDRDRGRRAESADRRRRKHSDPDRGRLSSSLGPERGRRSLSVDRDRGRHSLSPDQGAARHSASLEREPFAYRHYDPAKQPRDRLQHMTVKDAVTEYKHRVRNLSANAAMRKRAAIQRKVSSSVPDMASAENGQPEDASQLSLDPERRTLVAAVATFPRNAKPPGGAAFPGCEQPESARDHSSGGMSQEGGSVQSRDAGITRRNLGEQILEMCRTISGEQVGEREMRENVPNSCDTTDSGQSQNTQGVRRNVSSVLYINPEDIVVEPEQTRDRLSPRDSMKESNRNSRGIDVYLDNDTHNHHEHEQQRLRPLGQFMELRKTTPPFSSSPVVRERRISGSGDSIPSPVSVSPATSTHSRGPSVDNIPSSGSRDERRELTPVTEPPTSPSSSMTPSTHLIGGRDGANGVKPSPEITVDHAQPLESPSSEMVSSTDSWKTKRSSDQGFYSEPKESDTESEGDTSGFSTPPEEPSLSRAGSRHPITPSVLVNTVKNRLEVPKPKINRSVSDNTAETERAKSLDSSSSKRSGSTKSDSYVQARKAKAGSSQDSQEKPEQKTVPVMGTSVQQKYRRTFSPVRGGKGAEEPRIEDQGVEVQKQESRGRSPKRSPSPAGKTATQSIGEAKPNSDQSRPGHELSPEGDGLKRGQGSQRRPGYVSGRSFRRKKAQEAEETQAKSAEKSDGAKTVEQKEEEKKAKEQQAEDDISNRLSFYNKSIQTSDSLLNDLIKRSKGKRKMSLFSSGGKKSKKHAQVEVKVPVGLPPPDYEEERHLGQAPEVTSGEPVHQEIGPPVDVSSVESVLPALPPQPEASPADEPEVTPESGVHIEPVAEQHNVALPTESPTPKPKSSLRAIVALKQKLARNRKKKTQTKKEDKKVEEEKEEEEKKEGDLPSDTFIFIENELNLSKLAEIKETDILEDEIFEPDLGIDLPKKQIRFEPIASSEPIQSEEPLPPLSPASRRLAARRNSTRGRERRRKCLHCCKKFIAFLFSHIGLCSLVAGYTFMGGVVFQALEAPHEMDVKSDIAKQRNEYVDRIHSLAAGYRLNELSRDNLTAAILKTLISYQELIHKETKENGWDGKDIDPDADPTEEEYTQWSFASSLLYAITVMTTIGEY